jgi:GntR family transcriptional regulator
MNISLRQDSDVPLRHQLSEQIVFLITTGELRAGEEMPSVRALARRVNVHHNTVSKAYQELVRREWLTRKPGSRLVVRTPTSHEQPLDSGVDDLINETIHRARRMGYSLQALRSRVRERLLAEPADHLLVVEREAGLREIIQHEIERTFAWRVECCSPADLLREPGLAIGAQVLAPRHVAGDIAWLVPAKRPCYPLQYSNAAEQVATIRELSLPSTIAVVSVSASLLKTARSLLAASIGREHTFQELLLCGDEEADMRGADLVFCDSLAMPRVVSKRKVQYDLISGDCMSELGTILMPDL